MGDQKEQTSMNGPVSTGNSDPGGEQEEAPDWLIDNIAELSKNTRSLYLIYLGALLYCAVTVVGVTDRQMLLDEAVTLPLIGVGVPLTGFFVFAPAVLIATFVYLQLYLQDLQSLKRTMRETYGKEEPGRLYPWIMNVVDHPQPGLVGWLQMAAVKLVLWLLLPIVLFLFGFSYLKMQEPVLGTVSIILPAVGLWLDMFFWRNYEPSEGRFINSTYKFQVLIYGLLTQGVLTILFVCVSVIGFRPSIHESLTAIDVSFQKLVEERKLAPYWVNLSGKKLRWSDMEASILTKANLENARLNGANLRATALDGANLRSAHLTGVNLSSARLLGADLTISKLDNANLVGAQLDSANLIQANLSNADLRGVSFRGSRLSLANLSNSIIVNATFTGATLSDVQMKGSLLRESDLEGAILEYANLQKSDFSLSNLSGTSLDNAVLEKANLTGAKLSGARLQFANLNDANMHGAQIDSARLVGATMNGADLSGANFISANLNDSKLVDAHLWAADLRGARLMSANLRNATLKHVRLDTADLKDARLDGANLESASLKGTDLTCVSARDAESDKFTRVSTSQLCRTATLHRLKAPLRVIREIKAQCPARLLNPKEDESLDQRCPEFEIDEAD